MIFSANATRFRLLLALTALLFALWQRRRHRRMHSLDRRSKASASNNALADLEAVGANPGTFVRLSHGKTRYVLQGPESGPLVVCFHGFGVFAFVWDALASALASEGFRVLTFDFWSTGFSDGPPADSVPYDADLHVGQAVELLEALGLSGQRFTLIGHSIGGLLAGIFAARYPERLERLVLVCPAGVPVEPLKGSIYLAMVHAGHRLVTLPFLGKAVLQLCMQAVMRVNHANLTYDALSSSSGKLRRITSSANLRAAGGRFLRMVDMSSLGWAFQRRFNRRYAETIYSTLVHLNPFGDWTSTFAQIEKGPLRDRTMIAWGDRDEFIPCTSVCARAGNPSVYLRHTLCLLADRSYRLHLRHALPSATFVCFEDCDHFLYLNEPAAFQERLLAFMHGGGSDIGRSHRVRREDGKAGLEEFVVASGQLPCAASPNDMTASSAEVLAAIARLRDDVNKKHGAILDRLGELERAPLR